MKSLALFVGFCVLISLSYSTEVQTESSNWVEREKPCPSTCVACQQAVFSLKFSHKPNCGRDQCRSTVL